MGSWCCTFGSSTKWGDEFVSTAQGQALEEEGTGCDRPLKVILITMSCMKTAWMRSTPLSLTGLHSLHNVRPGSCWAKLPLEVLCFLQCIRVDHYCEEWVVGLLMLLYASNWQDGEGRAWVWEGCHEGYARSHNPISCPRSCHSVLAACEEIGWPWLPHHLRQHHSHPQANDAIAF